MVAFPPLALRLSGQDHALEPGRDYVVGSASTCDLVLPADAAPEHVRLSVREASIELRDLSGGRTSLDGAPVERASLQPGASLLLGATTVSLVLDHGQALMVPLPQLRAAARARRQDNVRSAALALLRRREAETFDDLIAHELRRAPWFGISLACHALLLFLLWLLVPVRRGGDDTPAQVAVDIAAAPAPGETVAEVPEVAVEQDEVDFAPPLPIDHDVAPPPVDDRRDDIGIDTLRDNARVAPRASVGGSNGDRGLTAEAGTIGSGGFQKKVAQLRDTGLEIMFVFDSTGSMSRTILDTKNTIAQMLTVLRALVPDARIGIVTYRDRGRSEDYVVRQLPLGQDFWRATNFMQTVSAEGGGDRPEDVRAGLRAAFSQRWRPGAQRVVVLAGDAPPHEKDERSLGSEVRAYAANGRSFLHALVTSPDNAGEDTRQSFRALAQAGGGECLDLQEHEQVLQRVLALAFGRDYEQDVAAVVRTVTAAADRVDVESLDLAHRGGSALQRELRREPVSALLLNALVRRPRRSVDLELIDQLGNRSTPDHTAQAIAWVLQRVLKLPVPPVDPERSTLPDAKELDRLRARCGDLPE